LLRVLGLVPYPAGRVPGQRYRIEQWMPHLRQEGIEVTLAPFLSTRAMDVLYSPGHLWAKGSATVEAYLRRLVEVVRPGDYQLAYVFREAALLGNAWLEKALARRLPLVLDFDDAIYLPNVSDSNRWVVALKSSRKVADICRLARHVTVGNETLAAFAQPLSRGVTVIPSTIDTDLYRIELRPPNVRPVVGWTGSETTAVHLKLLEPALAALRQSIDFEMRVIGKEVRLAGVDVHYRPWRADSEVDDLRAIDVGLMPLPDDEWSRGKCGMKALQYMGLGIPAVVSPVGANKAIVVDGVNGFHARTQEDWVDRIGRLLHDAELRKRLGAAARRTVEEGYSARVQAPRMGQVFREAARA
jgi:glycosyltransferase involved in cell wall biosynthesis